MSETPMLLYWMGKNVDEMTREEAIEALKILGKLYDRQLKDNIKHAEALAFGQCELWRRGIDA